MTLSGTTRSPQRWLGAPSRTGGICLASKLARQHVEEDLEACCIRSRHDQIDASAVLRGDRAVEIDIFADELRRDRGPPADWCPARADAVHAAETRLISEHDAQQFDHAGQRPAWLFSQHQESRFFKSILRREVALGVKWTRHQFAQNRVGAAGCKPCCRWWGARSLSRRPP